MTIRNKLIQRDELPEFEKLVNVVEVVDSHPLVVFQGDGTPCVVNNFNNTICLVKFTDKP